MATDTIRCNCGQRIVAHDVVVRNWFVRVFGPTYMYLKFRCSRCKRIGERFIEQERWDDALLRDVATESSVEERRGFQRLGPISVDEQVEFHFALEDPSLLSSLRGSGSGSGGS
jgi:DNA-directed RNA polymerase subunit RPC12/RpoP